jgi:hypothetical protein
MKTKKFDCVEMKHKAAEKIYETVVNMTREEELRFWNSNLENSIKESEIENLTMNSIEKHRKTLEGLAK